MDKSILNHDSAVKYCLQYLKDNGYHWHNIKKLNMDRYAIVYGNPIIAILFKTDFFLKYGEMLEGKGGIGESINVTDIKIMVREGVKDIYIVYRTGHIYKIDLITFLSEAKSWQNKEGKDIRSCSIHLLNRVNKEDDNYGIQVNPQSTV